MVDQVTHLAKTVLSLNLGWYWIAVVLVVLLGLAKLIRMVRSLFPVHKDPLRMLGAAERQRSFTRAGNRCEDKRPFWFRCNGPAQHGDHIYPWSCGGATSLANFQALCAHHNTSKGATIPSKFYIWRLERRRRHYFPPNESVKVNWHIGAVPAQAPPPPVVLPVTPTHGRGRGVERLQPRGRR